jgi:hypothetical protein
MDLKVIISLGLLAVLGFLFYPRGGSQITPMVDYDSEWISIESNLKDEPLRGAKLRKDNPVVETYDLGYIYKIDKADISFDGSPKSYDILTSVIRNEPKYDRLISALPASREYYYTRITFPPEEARWVQIVVNDWYGTRPNIQSTRIGARYSRHSQIRSIRTEYNPEEAFRLIDGLKDEDAPKWIGGKRVEEEVEKDGNTVKELTYESPDEDGVEILLDLGVAKRIYGISITTGGDENNLKQYKIFASIDAKNFQYVYTSGELENKMVTDLHDFGNEPVKARYIQIKIDQDGWYGKYPEIREVNIHNDEYRITNYNEPIEEHNAIQVYYDNCGAQGNTLAPDITQGFPFDRGEGTAPKERYLLKPNEEVDAKNSPNERSFCYHYDTIIASYYNLDPKSIYWVQVTYLQEKGGNRIQNLLVDGFLLHDSMKIPNEVAQKFTYAIPPEAYADREMELRFNRFAGPNAVVSEISILQASGDIAVTMTALGSSEIIGRAPNSPEPMVIDGSLNEWSQLFPLIPQQYKNDPLNSPCRMYVQWDKDNLFIAFKINRDKLQNTATDPPAYAQSLDTLHLFVDASLNRSPGMYRTGDHHFRFSRLEPSGTEKRILAGQIHHHLDAIPRTIEDNKEIELAISQETSGYTFEARIPKGKALYEFTPQPGGVLGFNYILDNPYLEEDLYWAAEDTGSPPASWGKLELVRSVSAQIAITDQSFTNRLTSFRAGDELILAVWDPDRNTDRNSTQNIKVRVIGDTTNDAQEIMLYETTPSQEGEPDAKKSGVLTVNNSDLFAGKLSTQFGTEPVDSSDFLTVQGGEIITLYYIDPYYSLDQRDVEITATAVVEVGTTGTIEILSESGEKVESFSAGDKLTFRVVDKDLVKAEETSESDEDQVKEPSEISVTVAGAKDIEKINLIDADNSGIFTGSIDTIHGAEGVEDGILQIMGSEMIKVTYQDSIQADGNTNVPIVAYATVKIGSTGILIVGKPGAGSIENFNAGDDLLIFLRDSDINTNAASVEKAEVTIEGNAIKDKVILTLTETEPDSDTFSGNLRTTYSLSADESNEMLEVKGNEAVTVTYTDALQANGATQVPVSETVAVNVGSDGNISILQANFFWELENFNAGDTLYFRIEDADLNTSSRIRDRVDISIVSEEAHDEETITLEEKNPDSGIFFGSLVTEFYGGVGDSSGSVKPDGVLQVKGAERVTAIYIDKLRSTGETNVPVIDSCKVSVGTTGKLTVYTKSDPYVPVAGYPDAGWKNKFKAGETLIIRLEDIDLNVSSAAAEIFQVSTKEDVIRDSVPVTLTEVSGSAGVFSGEVNTEYGTMAIPGDGILQVQGEGRVDIFYTDAITDTGQTNVLIPVSLTVETGDIGTLQALSLDGSPISSFSADDSFIIQVKDNDLNVEPAAIDRAIVMAEGNLLGDQLEIILQETNLNSGVFESRVQSIYSSQSNLQDTLLQVKEKELITLTYIDEVVATGETNVPVSIQLIVRSGIAGSLVIVDENYRELPNFNAGRRLYFRLDDFVLSSTSPEAKARVSVQNMGAGDIEEVLLDRVPSEQGMYTGSISTSYGTRPIQDGILQVQGGEEVRATYYPQTPGAPSEPIVDITYTNKGSNGRITIVGANGLKIANFNAGDTIYFRLEDMDLNIDIFSMEIAEIWVAGDAIASGRNVTLNETSADSGVFTGYIETRYGRGVFESRNILEVVGGEQITAVYYDALTSTGETDVKVTDSARVNMLGTAIYASEGVQIDGSMSGWPLENALRAGDEGSNIYVQWDEDNLYILAYIIDSEVVVPDPTQFWDGADALEIHIDIDPIGEVSPYLQGLKKPSYYFLWFCPKGAGTDGNLPYVGQNMPQTIYNYQAIETAVRIFPNRYVLEARIPFDPVLGGFDPYKTSRADRVGFNYIIRRSNAPQLRWATSAESESNLPPSFFGTLILKQP